MGSMIVLAVALVAANNPGTPSAPHATLSVARLSAFSVPSASSRADDGRLDRVIARARRDFEKRQKEVGLAGSTPLFGAEGLPKPALPRR